MLRKLNRENWEKTHSYDLKELIMNPQNSFRLAVKRMPEEQKTKIEALFC